MLILPTVLYFFGDEIEEIQRINPTNGKKISLEKMIAIFPANLFVTGRDVLLNAINEIQDDLVAQIRYFEMEGRLLEAQRIRERTEFDLEMMRELGYCSGIENYSRYFDHRSPGERPFCLLDYFPEDFLADCGRKPRNHAADSGYVGRRPLTKRILGGFWISASQCHGQSPAYVSGV
jgi:excinuclease UvrABC helicase subunit UvrB